jgi:hypothetical protein
VEIIRKLVGKALPPDALPAPAGAGGVAPLDHKVVDDAVEDDAVVVAVLGVGDEIFHRLRGLVGVKLHGDIPKGGFDDRGGALRLGKLRIGHNFASFSIWR